MKEKQKIIDLVDKSLSRGWRMAKLIHPPTFFYGAFYDRKTAYTTEELKRFSDQGYKLEDDAGVIALNILLGYERE